MATYEPLHHKYRPQIFADLVGQNAIADTLTNAINRQRIAPAYLFTGPRGTGKTSSARILAKSLNCISSAQPTPIPCGQCEVCRAIAVGSALDVIEIDAASNTGVDNIREIIERAQFAPVQCRYKVYVIDECHMLSVAAFNALLKTLEEPPDRVIFVLATTDPQRVLPTIISRCQRFDYRRIPLADMVKHLEMIAHKEAIDITSEAVTLVAQIANGGLRDAESLLDQLSLLSDTITPEKVWDLVGAVPERDLLELIKAIQTDQAEAVLENCRHLMNRGREPLVVLQNLAGFYLNLLIARTAPNRPDMVAVTSPTWEALCQEAEKWSTEEILRGQKQLKDSELQLKNSTQPRLWLEVTLLGLLPSANKTSTVVTSSENSTFNSQNSKTVSPLSSENSQFGHQKPTESQQQNAKVAFSKPQTPQTASTPSPAPINVSSNDLNSVWQALLSYLPQFTAGLMQQQANLTDLQENVAYISLKTEPLLRMAKGKLKDIETALEKVCQRPIKVHLQVASSTPHAPSTPPAPTAPSTPTASSTPPAPPAPTAPSTPPASSASSASQTPPSTSPLPKTEIPDFTETEIKDIDKIVENFAKIFEGEIIELDNQEEENNGENLDEDKTISQTQNIQNLEQETATIESHTIEVNPESKPKMTRIIGRPEPIEKIEEDEDIPF